MSTLPFSHEAQRPRAPSTGNIGDAVMLTALGAAAVAAIAIAGTYGDMALGAGLSALMLMVGGAVFLLARGTVFSRNTLALCLSTLVALHIQLGRGTVEFHFGVFVTLGLLLMYRDWRPIVLSAVFFVVHHLLFDRLQAAGWAVYCTPETSLLKMVMHSGYVVMQTGLEVFMAINMKEASRERLELEDLVHAVNTSGAVSLDVRHIAVQSGAAVGLKQALERMHVAMSQVQASAANIQLASQEIASGNMDLSQRTEQTASNLQKAASAMDQLTGTVKQTAESAHQANRLAATAAEVAVRGGSVVSQVVSTMDEINASSKRIGDIIGVIDGIAFQTNILALNAAVEAARAGEQGRGFAVVASEVRSLAKRSAEAAREIKTLIGASVGRVESGSKLVADAGQTMTEIVASVQSVSAIIGEISTASMAQSDGVGEVSHSVGQLEQMTQQNAALVEQSGAAAASMSEQARRLGEVLRGFKLQAA